MQQADFGLLHSARDGAGLLRPDQTGSKGPIGNDAFCLSRVRSALMQTLRDYALSYLGTPYKWGGETYDGIDCNGFVQQVLKSVGIAPKDRLTSQGLLDYFDKLAALYDRPGLGSLAFYGESTTKIDHVALMLDNYRVIEAGGGDHLTLTRDDAIARNAFVRIRLLKHRPDLVAVLRPSYATIGVV